jgi:hypothetical protein
VANRRTITAGILLKIAEILLIQEVFKCQKEAINKQP